MDHGQIPDSLSAWMDHYQQLAIAGVRSEAVAKTITLHLHRFLSSFQQTYGHDRISSCLRRDIVAWQTSLQNQDLSPATINSHLASLSGFTTWVQSQDPKAFPIGNPTKGIGGLGLQAPESRALNEDQIRSLKNLCDRLHRFYQLKGRRHQALAHLPVRAKGRPWRDKAIVLYCFPLDYVAKN